MIKKAIHAALHLCNLEVTRAGVKRKCIGTYSNLDEEKIILHFLESLGLTQGGYCVDIAASDGVSMSNTYSLFKDRCWRGLAIEFDRDKFSTLASSYRSFADVDLAKCKVTPLNVVSLLLAHEAPKCFDFLNLDIDGYDYFVLEQILKEYRPKLICVEINEKIPPPVKFTVHWSSNYLWAGDHFYGQSISQLHSLALISDYSLVELHYNNAFLIANECKPTKSLFPYDAYRTGYLEKSDRLEKFPWNQDMEEIHSLQPSEVLDFIRRYFSKYEGMFTASL